MSTPLSLAAVVLVTVATVAVGSLGLRFSRTTSDFYVASRAVTPGLNASAISGEYLSAASFLGVAGLVMAYGADMLWYPVGYAAGYLVLLLLVAAPLRRSGAYTLPDFAEARLASLPVRRIASLLVVLIGWLYLLPQLQGAGLTLRTMTGAPRWVGAVVVAVVVVANVLAGGMRSITLVQAFQYWLKLTAISVPIVFCLLVWRSDGAPAVTGEQAPTFDARTAVRLDASVTLDVTRPVGVRVRGVLDGVRRDGPVTLGRGQHTAAKHTRLVFPEGAAVPHVSGLARVDNHDWALPLTGAGGRPHPLYATYSIVLATFLGTMGLPHVLVRFYTNPDGRAARRTTLAVLGLLGVFYLVPTVYGVLGRLYVPELLMTGRTDAVVLLLPGRMLSGLGGELLGALVTAGAFAAFLSTSSGLTVSVAGVLSQDVLRGSVRDFRLAAVAAGTVPCVLSLLAGRLPVAAAVGLAFAVAASSFCPLLLLGIWWHRLTDVGAAAGLVVGGGLAASAVLVTIVAHPSTGWVAALLTQPAALTVPVAFVVMVVLSLLTPGRTTPDVWRVMGRMHAPETLRLSRHGTPRG